MLHLLLNKHFTLHATHSQKNNYKHTVKELENCRKREKDVENSQIDSYKYEQRSALLWYITTATMYTKNVDFSS
jgi:hypothetical protein